MLLQLFNASSVQAQTNAAAALQNATENAAASALASAVTTAAVQASVAKCCCEGLAATMAEGTRTRERMDDIERAGALRRETELAGKVQLLTLQLSQRGSHGD